LAKKTRSSSIAGNDRACPYRRSRENKAVMVYPTQQAELVPHNSYTIDIDRRNRNCYSYGGFGYLVWNCKR